MSEEKKPDISDKQLELTVKDQSGGELKFKVKTKTRLEKVFNAFASRKQLDPKSIKFTFDGRRLNGATTPGDNEMEDGDVIEAMMEQVGGCC